MDGTLDINKGINRKLIEVVTKNKGHHGELLSILEETQLLQRTQISF
jgi:hypothetical protein